MKKLIILGAAVAALAAALVAHGQVLAGDPVPGETGLAYPLQSATGADPDSGLYPFLVHAYIGSYARVTVYDNEIAFSAAEMVPDLGSTKDGGYKRKIATGTDAASYQSPIAVPGATGFNLAGLKVETNCRLDVNIDMIGHMQRATETGVSFTGKDSRRGDLGNYELATQYKVNFKGLYFGAVDNLTYAGPAQNAYLGDGSTLAFVSPTSGTNTGYNVYTGWDDVAGTLGETLSGSENLGWLWPDVSDADMFPWSGTAYTAYSAAPAIGFGDHIKNFSLVVERGQADSAADPVGYGNTNYKQSAEIWFAYSVLRRGLQDVMGNYKVEPIIQLFYRESDSEWDPA